MTAEVRRPEILAPAGSPEVLRAAVRCGADAVYLGGRSFNARRGASNFSPEDLAEAVAYAHGRGVKIYLTLNTLVLEREMGEALEAAGDACRLGVDALIVQDVGLARRLHAAAPAMPLHASTQLSCHSPAGVRALAEAGFSRVVLAREMTRDEIAACGRAAREAVAPADPHSREISAYGVPATGSIELEVFVHGALCVSVSGQCLLSAALGGARADTRSGNRGLCAQPCRLPFAAGDRTPRPGDAALSLKDLSLLEHVPELAALGVRSLKIEGRMKRPEYVAAATACYAAAVRGEPLPERLTDDLRDVFSRSGFTDGYFTGCRTGMGGVRREDDVSASAAAEARLRGLYAREAARVPVRLTFSAAAGEAASLTAEDDDGLAVTVRGPVPETARDRATDAGRVREALAKTGGTPFCAESAACSIGEGLVLPVAAVNAMRREALDTLLSRREAPRPVEFFSSPLPDAAAAAVPAMPVSAAAAVPPDALRRAGDRPRLVVRLPSAGPLPNGADAALLPLDTPPDALAAAAAGRPVYVEIPRALFGREAAAARQLETARAAGAAGAFCGTVGAVRLARAAGLTPVAGWSLNIANADALSFWTAAGAGAAMLSAELSFAQMRFAWARRDIPLGLFAYGRLPLMLLRRCPVRDADGCRGGGDCALTDRRGARFPVSAPGFNRRGCSRSGGGREADGEAVELFNSVPLYLADDLDSLPPADFLVLYFTDETPARVGEVISAYRRGAPPPDAFTRGLYRRGLA